MSVTVFLKVWGNRILVLVAILTMLCTIGCTAQPDREKRRFFWPPVIDAAKIEYINFFHSDYDVKRGEDHWLADAILGKEKPQKVFSRPNAISSDGGGRIFVADQSLHEVVVWDLPKHEIRGLGRSGSAMSFQHPAGVEALDDGRIFVSDSETRKVFRFSKEEELDLTFADNRMARPSGLAADVKLNRLYVADPGNHSVHVFSLDGVWLSTLGERGSGDGQFNFPLDVDLDQDGNLYVLDSMNSRIQVFSPDGTYLRKFGERGTAKGSFQVPKGLAVSPSGLVCVIDTMGNHFLVFDLKGDFLLAVGGSQYFGAGTVSPGGFYMPNGIDIDKNETIWVADTLNQMFHQFQYLNKEYLMRHPIE